MCKIHNWQKIAAETVKVYKEVYEEYLSRISASDG